MTARFDRYRVIKNRNCWDRRHPHLNCWIRCASVAALDLPPRSPKPRFGRFIGEQRQTTPPTVGLPREAPPFRAEKVWLQRMGVRI